MQLATTLKRLTAALALALAVAAIASGAHADTTTVSPTHWWTADGTAADSAGTDDGVALNGADYAPGVRGQAFHLDGPAAEFRFDTSGGNFEAQDFTLAFFMRTTSLAQQAIVEKRPICDAGSFWGFRMRDGIPGAELDANGRDRPVLSSNRFVADGQWHHVALVRAGTTATLYVDGTPAASDTTPEPTMLHNDAPLRVGMSACTGIDGTGPYSGDLDELMTFPAALSQADVEALAAGVIPQPRVADLSVVVQSPDHVRLGDQFAYDLTIANAGPDDAQAVHLTDELPAGVMVEGYSGPECAFSGQPVPGQASRLDCSWNTFAAGTSVHVYVVGRADRLGAFVSTVRLSAAGDDPVETNDVSAATTQVTLPRVPGVVVGWGCVGVVPQVDAGQCNARDFLSDAVAVAAGQRHSLALESDGTVVAWGCFISNFGQCNVPPDLAGAAAIAAGSFHSLALRRDGTVAAWGCGPIGGPVDRGQCNVPAGSRHCHAIAAGGSHSLALKRNGTVVSWGCGAAGDAGSAACRRTVRRDRDRRRNGAEPRLAARRRRGRLGLRGNGELRAVRRPCRSRRRHGDRRGHRVHLALKGDGTVVAWGCAGIVDFGQCSVPAGLVDVVAIAAGGRHALALRRDGTVVAWGCRGIGDFGQCSVPSALTGVSAISAGQFNGLAVAGSSQSLTRDVLSQAGDLPAGASKRDAGTLKSVVTNLAASLSSSLWLDVNHADTKRGPTIFDRHAASVALLMKSSIAPAQEMIDGLVRADEFLARVALGEAAASGDAKKLADAQKELSLAEQSLDQGRFDLAITHYKNAWQKAQQAAA